MSSQKIDPPAGEAESKFFYRPCPVSRSRRRTAQSEKVGAQSINIIDADRDSSIPFRAKRLFPRNVNLMEFGEPPLIDEWAIVGNLFPECEILIGAFYGHPELGDIAEGRTSPVLWISKKHRYARTVNRIYRLGAPVDPYKDFRNK